MSQSKTEFIVSRIIELVDKVIERESIPRESESSADLDFIKYYAKDLLKGCKNCNPPSGSQNEKND